MIAHRSREILVIHPGALGDVLQAVPALGALRALNGCPRLTFAGQARLGRLLAAIGLVDASLPFDALGLHALFTRDPLPPEVQSRFGAYDRIVSWFGARAEPFPERLRSLVPDVLLARPVPEDEPSVSVWEHLLGTLAPWGVGRPGRPAPLALPEEWHAEAREVLSRLGVGSEPPLLIVHPGAGGGSKRWPADGFARVIRRVVVETGCQVVVHQGPADGGAVAELTGALDLPLSFLVEPPLPLLAAVLREAGAFLGADSGVSHLAAVVGAPAIILYPPATRTRWAPWSPTALPVTMTGTLGEVESVVGTLGERLARAGRPEASAARSVTLLSAGLPFEQA